MPQTYFNQPLTSYPHIQYTPNDPLGFICALLSLMPVFIIIALITLTIDRRRNSLVFTSLLGQIGNTIINVITKHIIRQPRPMDTHSYGMPSNHAQFIFFFIGFWIPKINKDKLRRITALIIVACAVATSRVYLHYHTTNQVVVGAGIGLGLGYIWHKTTESEVYI